ncbi:PfkB family carbohydrate kinase [Lysinibacillus fusiformis]|uniref:PfkB family carbohydrate kinase n=1 Tax=Lysinibacillus fusiformis TaxID=28031 RepID=UPI003556872A
MITVIGSLNMDLVVQMNAFPKQGETILGHAFQTVPGGKGANQAVATARLGSDVAMIGCVGQDSFGERLCVGLQQEQVNTDAIVHSTTAPTGIANILIFNQDNRIVVVPGANYELAPSHIEASKDLIQKSQMVIIQLEIPKETTAYAGSDGARYFDGTFPIHIPGYMTTAVDTTGAGDTFNGALAHALVEGQSLDEAVYFANLAASLSVEKFSAQGGMPTLGEVYACMAGTGK